MKNIFFSLILCLSASLLLAPAVYAHKPSDSYLTLFAEKSSTHGRWDIALRDLDYAIGLDENNDGIITWGEVKSNEKKIIDYTLERLRIKVGEKYCQNQFTGLLIDKHSDGTYAVLNFTIDSPSKTLPTIFDIDYKLFFDIDPLHRGLLSIEYKGKTLSAIFSPDKSTQHFNLNSLNPWYQFFDFLKNGIWHIWIGFDHILFLISLLLPSVLLRKEKKWVPVKDFKTAFWSVFEVVTAFTLAHSVTLSLAVLGLVQLPSRLVESLIALSVILAALNNVFPVLRDGRWIAAYLFGLIHGFGFASVLMDLNLNRNSLLTSLLSFNLGVEIGQLAIVALFIPIAYKIRNSWVYEKLFLTGGSIIISVIALVWFIERAFNLTFF